MAGYDGIFIKGKADTPVYLFVHEGNVTIEDATELWGKDTYQTEKALKEKWGKDIGVVSIGQAGEKLVLIANIMHDEGAAAGRSGFGALMGSKKLKAIAVRGKGNIPIASPKRALNLRRQAIKAMDKDLVNAFRRGNAYTPDAIITGDAPTKNWSGIPQQDFPDVFNWNKEDMHRYRVKTYACWKCPIADRSMAQMDSKQYGLVESHQPEYETTAAFTGNCLNSNFESVIKINDMCNRYGMDTISAGGLVAFTMDCFERGIISKKDTDGLEMRWGNHKAMVALIEKIAKREGIGDVLADGLEKAAEHVGQKAQNLAIHVRGEALPMHDPRCEPAMALIYKVNASPGKHLPASQFIKPPGLDLQVPASGTKRHLQRERAKVVRILEALNNSNSCAGLCLRGYLLYDVQFLPKFLTAVTGKEWTLEELTTVGERIANMRQAFNIRDGVNLIDEYFPSLVLGNPPFTKGPLKGVTIDLESMIDEYFQAMGWSMKDGRPLRRKLVELGLEDVAQDLYP